MSKFEKKPFEYFTAPNEHDIYIEDRGGRINRYAVYEKHSCVDDCLNKVRALSLANWCLYERLTDEV